jgi:hypothetical protein
MMEAPRRSQQRGNIRAPFPRRVVFRRNSDGLKVDNRRAAAESNVAMKLFLTGS